MFDRSWYNRAGVERVMGFCTDHEYQRFMRLAPGFERTLADNGILLIKYWFDVSMDEQQRRFQDRIDDERKQWKLSPMDTESFNRWYDYSRARDAMFEVTDTDDAPWHVVPSDDKKRARLNCISHLLSTIPYKELTRPKVKLGKRDLKGKYDDETPSVAVLWPERQVAQCFSRLDMQVSANFSQKTVEFCKKRKVCWCFCFMQKRLVAMR